MPVTSILWHGTEERLLTVDATELTIWDVKNGKVSQAGLSNVKNSFGGACSLSIQ